MRSGGNGPWSQWPPVEPIECTAVRIVGPVGHIAVDGVAQANVDEVAGAHDSGWS